QADTPTLIIAGLLVGLGTRYGAGCTSGHGVCGLARRSLRSLVAALTFMAAGFITVFLLRHGFA
ncbi:MAG: YeeE/YedE family protein, partial [Gammaproteobacteria bacterium]